MRAWLDTLPEWWPIVLVGLVWGGVIVLWRAIKKRTPPEAGAPEVEVVAEDDTTPIDMPTGMMNPCPHGIAVSEPCPKCNGVMRGKHITLDDPDQPRVPPPPPVGPKPPPEAA